LKEGEETRIDNEFVSTLYRLNETHSFRSEKEVFKGEIVGVNEIGQLLIQNQQGKMLAFHFKEVEFLPVG
jgi:BirA family biotin operon repressor/biotin-[acetyl-CoA-carboxylase] ligase